MASQIAFSVVGAGYSGISYGMATLAIKTNGVKLLYRSTLCQGTGGAKITAAAFDIKNDVGSEHILFYFQGYSVKFQISNFLHPFGDVADFAFEIYDTMKTDPIYKVGRKPMMSGICAGGASIISTFEQLQVKNGTFLQNEDLWEAIWNGQGAITQS